MTAACRGVCITIYNEDGQSRKPNYVKNERYCTTCEFTFYSTFKENRCPCCCYLLRSRPHNVKWRRKLLKFRGVIRI